MVQLGNTHQSRLFFSMILLGMQSVFKTLVYKSFLASENHMISTGVSYSFFFSLFFLLLVLILVFFNKLILCRRIGVITLGKTNRQGES